MRGKKTAPEKIYAVMAVWSITDSYSETARQLNMSVTTVKDIVEAHRDDEEFVKLRNENKLLFERKASAIIDKGMRLLNRRFDRALEQEGNLDELIEEIYDTDAKELNQDEKKRLVNTVRHLQLQDIKAITTAIGTLYDKKSLSAGDATENVRFVGSDKELEKLAKIAGYVKKGK